MTYSRSVVLQQWLTTRRDRIDRIEEAHSVIGQVSGPGRPLELGKPLAHAYIIRVVAEFQGFARDLYDLAIEQLVVAAEPRTELAPLLVAAATRGRSMDAGNPTLTTLRTDFSRLGIRNLEAKISSISPGWVANGSDRTKFSAILEMRNALAHGNQRQVEELRRQGRQDTVTWAKGQLPAANRLARALDRVVFDQLTAKTGAQPW